MTVILREIPGLAERELIDAVHDIVGPDVTIDTGYGGIVVSEAVALRFLAAYLDATSAVDATVTDQAEGAVQAEPEKPQPPAQRPRAGGPTRKRKEDK
jgi:hypothetical protein